MRTFNFAWITNLHLRLATKQPRIALWSIKMSSYWPRCTFSAAFVLHLNHMLRSGLSPLV